MENNPFSGYNPAQPSFIPAFGKHHNFIFHPSYFPMASGSKVLEEASVKTANDLRNIASSAKMLELSALSLPEIDAVVDTVSKVVPAGNVPGVILNGLARLPGRRPPAQNVRRDIELLFKGVEKALDKAVYGAFFAGPAAVIWGYQNLLKLAGKEVEQSFPDGQWQFYVEYALREDTARFAIETHGFDTVLRHHNLDLPLVNRLTAWVIASIYLLHQFDDLLTNEWRERTYIALLEKVTEGHPQHKMVSKLYRTWEGQRPYGRGTDAAAHDSYASYRRQKFDAFLRQALSQLDEATVYHWNQAVQVAKEELPDYLKQMSILAYLEPTAYGESRQPIPLNDACVGLIYQGRYYLIPACQPGTMTPPSFEQVQAQIAHILSQPSGASSSKLTGLAGIKRKEWLTLRPKLNQTLRDNLQKLRFAPILVNADPQHPGTPLSDLRRTERGVGDHPLTLFDTHRTFIFDASHIFFDGAWASAVAEILTREALAWGVFLRQTKPAELPDLQPLKPLTFPFERGEPVFIQQSEQVTPEVTAETETAQIKPILALRKMFKMRSDLLQLTVNDLLILYRAYHALLYQPDPELVAALQALAQDYKTRTAGEMALEAIYPNGDIPPVLIPIDATQKEPKQRLYPLVFEPPLYDLNMVELHRQTLAALETYQTAAPAGRLTAYAEFDRLQREYLATLAGFGQVLTKAKEIANSGEGASQGSIKLLAHMPPALQHLLDTIPGRFDVLNDLIKGREVFSNVGAVAPTSTLVRFCTAKDDNEKKTLCWGIITDANGVLRITLRDFRPHVTELIKIGRRALASQMTHHYLESYARGLNTFVEEIQRITRVSRETQIVPPPK